MGFSSNILLTGRLDEDQILQSQELMVIAPNSLICMRKYEVPDFSWMFSSYIL